jgi:hypothetical protein
MCGGKALAGLGRKNSMGIRSQFFQQEYKMDPLVGKTFIWIIRSHGIKGQKDR